MSLTPQKNKGLTTSGSGLLWQDISVMYSFNLSRFFTFGFCFLLLFFCKDLRAQTADISRMMFSEDGVKPAIAANDSGEFMMLYTRVRWDLVNQSQGGTPIAPPTHLFGRLFHADGTPKGDSFEVYTGAALSGNTVVRSSENGNFTCYWSISPRSTTTSKPIIYSRKFDSNGRARTEPQSIITTGNEIESNRILMTFDADMISDGTSVVVWSESVDLYDANSVIYAQRFDTRGRKTGPVIHVTTPEPPANQSKTEVSVSMDEDGAFAVAWLHRFFPDFPSAEVDIDLKVAIFGVDGQAQESVIVLRHEDIPSGHERLLTRVKKIAGNGFVVMTNHTKRRESNDDKVTYSSTFEGRKYAETGEPSALFISDEWEVEGQSMFDLTVGEGGNIGLVYEAIESDVKLTRFAEISSDLSDVLNVQTLRADGEISKQSEGLPVILAKPDGTYIYALTETSDDFILSRKQFLKGGFIRPSNIGEENSKQLSIAIEDDNMLSIWFESAQGKNYRLLKGEDLHAMEQIELIQGTGQQISRHYTFSLGMEFFAVVEE